MTAQHLEGWALPHSPKISCPHAFQVIITRNTHKSRSVRSGISKITRAYQVEPPGPLAPLRKVLLDFLMGVTKVKQRRFWKLLWFGVVACLFMFMLSIVFHKQGGVDNSWLEYRNNEIAGENCSCDKIIQGDHEEVRQAKLLSLTRSFKNKTQLTNKDYLELTKDCEMFRTTRKYLPFPLSEEEEAFPVAYSITVHHKVQNLERLLRAIYSPQNLYCIHVDKKSSASFLEAVMAITSCFDNVFIATRLESVVYASWSRVQADINCMNDLYNNSGDWKYFINLCGQDFPIKTNLEIVRSLKALRGGNSMETETMPSGKEYRWKIQHLVVDGHIKRMNKYKGPPPPGVKVYSGGAYIIVSRAFVRFVLEDPKAQTLIEWSKDTFSPDEFLWATLQRMSGVPGSLRPNSKYDITDMNSISRLVKWSYHEGASDAAYPPCQGTHIRAVCVYGSGDLQWMLEQHHLFANKFDTDFDPVAMHCLERYLRHRALQKKH